MWLTSMKEALEFSVLKLYYDVFRLLVLLELKYASGDVLAKEASFLLRKVHLHVAYACGALSVVPFCSS